MNTFAIAAVVAAALSITASAGFAAQTYGRDSVYVQPGQAVVSSAPSAAAKTEVTRFGRDSVFVTKNTQLSKPNPVTAGETVNLKPGRA